MSHAERLRPIVFLFAMVLGVNGLAANGEGAPGAAEKISVESAIVRAQEFLEAQFLTSSEEVSYLRRFFRAADRALPQANSLYVEISPDRRAVEISLVEHARCAADLEPGAESPRVVEWDLGSLSFDLRPRSLPSTVCTYVVFQAVWNADEVVFFEHELSVQFDGSGNVLVLDLEKDSFIGVRYPLEGTDRQPAHVITAALALAMQNYDERQGRTILPTTTFLDAYQMRAREFLVSLPHFGNW